MSVFNTAGGKTWWDAAWSLNKNQHQWRFDGKRCQRRWLFPVWKRRILSTLNWHMLENFLERNGKKAPLFCLVLMKPWKKERTKWTFPLNLDWRLHCWRRPLPVSNMWKGTMCWAIAFPALYGSMQDGCFSWWSLRTPSPTHMMNPVVFPQHSKWFCQSTHKSISLLLIMSNYNNNFD